jgi:UV DNA damage endonuclease
VFKRSEKRFGCSPELHVDLDLTVDLNNNATEHAIRRKQDMPVIVQVHDDVQVHLQNGIATNGFGTAYAAPLSMLRLGLCCGFVSEDAPRFRTTTVRYASTLPAAARTQFLHDIAEHNLDALSQALRFCAERGIQAFRIVSGLLPLYTHPVVGWRLTASRRGASLRRKLRAIGGEARALNIRLSFHPDQFVVLGSTSESTVAMAIAELEYQAECAELLQAEQLTVHGGGAVGGKLEALARFRAGFSRLSPRARSRVVLENDDRVYTVADLLPLCRAERIPLVYDVHHHRCNPDGLSVADATREAAKTWRGREPWLHISSPAAGWSGGDPRAHAEFIKPSDVPREWLGLHATVDVEAKQKERAVLRLQRWLSTRAPAANSGTPSARKVLKRR